MRCKTKYVWQTVLGMTAYALGLVTLNLLYRDKAPHQYLLILLPVLPLIYTGTVIIRYVSELDEMWRKVLTEAMAFSAIATGFTSFSYLFLRDMGAPEFHAEWPFYMMWGFYGVGAFFSYRRYR